MHKKSRLIGTLTSAARHRTSSAFFAPAVQVLWTWRAIATANSTFVHAGLWADFQVAANSLCKQKRNDNTIMCRSSIDSDGGRHFFGEIRKKGLTIVRQSNLQLDDLKTDTLSNYTHLNCNRILLESSVRPLVWCRFFRRFIESQIDIANFYR